MFVQANNEFATDLYHQLARENGGENLFFSPYSMFNVLAMAAEGARGVTAEEMGAVLRFPAGLRRSDQDGSEIPWDLGPLHAGISGFNAWIRSGDEGSDTKIRAQIKESRMKLYDIGKRAEELERQGTQQEKNEVAEEARRAEAEFKALLAQADPNEIRVANALWGELPDGRRVPGRFQAGRRGRAATNQRLGRRTDEPPHHGPHPAGSTE